MIIPDKRYIIDGWAVEIVIDIIKSLKEQIQKNQRNYTKDEFLNIVDRYDFSISYLINLKTFESQSDIYIKDTAEIPTELKKLLKTMNIKVDKNKRDENDKPSE